MNIHVHVQSVHQIVLVYVQIKVQKHVQQDRIKQQVDIVQFARLVHIAQVMTKCMIAHRIRNRGKVYANRLAHQENIE